MFATQKEPKGDNKTEALEILGAKRSLLVSAFLKKNDPGFLEQHTHILDEYFRTTFEESVIGPEMGIFRNPYAIIAIGGYGRREMCIHSDLDILFLFKKNVPDRADGLIREAVYPLWDLGLDVGHATRSIGECIRLAGKDIGVLTSLLDARFICGQSLLYSELMDHIQQKIIQKRAKEIIPVLVEMNRDRHERYGDSSYLLEPNLKEGQGGLRDYHTMLWIARLKSEIGRPRDLELNGYISHAGFGILEKALSFIWNVRNHLHHLARRKCDRLFFEYQLKLAKKMGFNKGNREYCVETFLGTLHGQMELLKETYLMFIIEHGYASARKNKKRTSLQSGIPGLEVKDGMLYFASSEHILNSPDLLIHIFEESLRLKIPLSAEAKLLVRELSFLFDERLRTSSVKSFERILASKPTEFNVLNEMLSAGFLEQFIPQFKGIVHRIQHDEYHLYPVDKHSLLTVRIIKGFSGIWNTSQPPLCISLYKELAQKRLLLWAALLHDIGKVNKEKNHSKRGAIIAGEILESLGFKRKDIETVMFLIEQHLLLMKTATRRDINDEETAIFCARKIVDIERLKMLYLLTVADSMATGPAAWNDWTSALLQSLFLRILHIMEGGELATHKAVELVEKKKEQILSSSSTMENRNEMKEIFSYMSPRYLLYTPTQDILQHITLYTGLGSKPFVWEVTGNTGLDIRTVTICATDRPGLFSKIAGTFTLNGMDILESQAYTWRNNIALDIFKVKPPVDRIRENEWWARARQDLKAAISGTLDLRAALDKRMSYYRPKKHRLTERPNQVTVDNNSSSFFTIIEVFTYDFPGLLYMITDALFRCGLDVRVAKIATKVDQVVDVFYVRDFDGQKVDDPNQADKIKETIIAALPVLG